MGRPRSRGFFCILNALSAVNWDRTLAMRVRDSALLANAGHYGGHLIRYQWRTHEKLTCGYVVPPGCVADRLLRELWTSSYFSATDADAGGFPPSITRAAHIATVLTMP